VLSLLRVYSVLPTMSMSGRQGSDK
jgi:hypothetical protein